MNFHRSVVQGVYPCVAQMAENGAWAPENYSASVSGCNLVTIDFIALPPDAPTEVPARTDAIRLQTKPAPDMSRDENFDELERDADELEFRGNHAGDRGANGGQHAAVFAVGV